ncbi:hypothetical protein CJ030_MR5G023752 [Morella rubra]|uniref:Uncharacterized protein n=1 Tax=Morella rubra TaxID=262757 RepID=A0A6A1VLN6_9ROSI|nr:hypothetical protein CJ030_MR5G023752 [Morella rubra]
MNTLAIEQDVGTVRDCEDKEVTIKELTTLLHSSDVAASPSSSDLGCSPVDRPHVLVAKLEEMSIKSSNSASTRSQMSKPANRR